MSGSTRGRRCVITGMGVISAAGVGVPAFLEALREGRGGARQVANLRSPRHQPPLAAPVRDAELEARRKPRDRAFVLAELAAEEALDQAGVVVEGAGSALAANTIGLVLGTTLGGAIKAQSWHQRHLAGEPGSRRDLLEAPLDAVADHLARRFGLGGQRTVVSNACVSGTNAVGIGLDLIRSGEAERVLAGGVDSLHSFNFVGFANLGALSSGRCDPFHPAGRGMLLGEAAAFLVLEDARQAEDRGAEILAEVSGYGAACDAFHITAPSPEGKGASNAIRATLADAATGIDEVDLVLLHGVGTAFMDGMEATTMEGLFGERRQPVAAASLRPVTGHTLGGVGALDTVASVLAIWHGFVPPTGRDEVPSRLPECVRLERAAAPEPVERVLNTSSGFGGVNAALLVTRWHDDEPTTTPGPTADDIVITGFGVLHPSARQPSLVDLASVLDRGQPPPCGALDDFDYGDFFPGKRSKRERKMDRVGQFASCAALAAMADAGLSSIPDPRRVALIGGTAFGGLEACADFHRELLEMGPDFINPLYFPNTAHNVACSQAAVGLGIEGPTLTVTTGLAAGLDAVIVGARLLRSGRADIALVGGYERWFGALESAFATLDGDAGARWTAPVEGACFLVLERATTASARGARALGHIAGWAQASDPSPRRAGGALATALLRAREAAGEVDATTWCQSISGSSARNDERILRAYRELPAPRSVLKPKSAFGETFGAAGPLAIVACLASASPGLALVDALAWGGAASAVSVSVLPR